jgi:S-adenosylmethionine/arginine decarboxylase-like enzyme
MSELLPLGRRMYVRGIVLYGRLTEKMWRDFLNEAARDMNMSPIAKPAVWTYPLYGEGGVGSTIVQPITESFLALDTWPDHGGAYLMICSCRSYSTDCLNDLIEHYGLRQGHSTGTPIELEIEKQ